ncbi:MAG: hypothetical protein A2042_03470 [Candidatus Schekmanbacteria bacterium GWA2_38_11]|uniref:Cytochrome-c oxidase n=1 Tax=Candidatus Schekmanbacteria bacterium GWA2_38_11 TaxID=1817876 RepID=A0A1F7RE73_9BACT|nr:MAG: hypothetical protein A2042_03470 [Candidatus Schekmanbacteria bacterium GWA2_38_11]
MEYKENEEKVVSYGTYILVWFGLLVFTGLTVTVSGMNLGRLSIIIPLLIASSKAGMVIYFFMHLKYEGILFKVMLFITLLVVTIFIGFTFFDISYR